MNKNLLIVIMTTLFLSVSVASAQTAAQAAPAKPQVPAVALPKPKGLPDLACATRALTIREDSIIALDTKRYKNGNATVLQRKKELTAAWAMTDLEKRRAAIAASWRKFRNTVEGIRGEYEVASENAYNTYNKMMKDCKIHYTENRSFERNNGTNPQNRTPQQNQQAAQQNQQRPTTK